MSEGEERRHAHQFDRISGYCECGVRDDGSFVRLKSGTRFRYPPGVNPALDERRIDQIIQAMKEAKK